MQSAIPRSRSPGAVETTNRGAVFVVSVEDGPAAPRATLKRRGLAARMRIEQGTAGSTFV